MPFILFFANLFGISVFRLAIYAACIVAVIAAGLTVRQHYVNLGWKKAITAVRKQDDRAVAAAERVEQKTAKCDASSGYWDVITQNCRLQEEK